MTPDDTSGSRARGGTGGIDAPGSGTAGASAASRPAEGRDREEIPLGQRLYDSPFLLLIAGILIMFICFTGWGLWEILSLPPAPLP